MSHPDPVPTSTPDAESEYDHSTLDLLEHLDRIEAQVQGQFSGADIQRDVQSPSLNTFYRRFGWEIEKVRDAYETWDMTGEVPDPVSSINWHAFHTNQNTYTTDELMNHLDRIDAALDRTVEQNDVRQDDDAPTVDTYFLHFSPESRDWDAVLSVYEDWQQHRQTP